MKYIIYQLHDFRTLGWYKSKKEQNPTYTDPHLKLEWYESHAHIPIIIADAAGYQAKDIHIHTINESSSDIIDGIYDICLKNCRNVTRICLRTSNIVLCDIQIRNPISEFRICIGDAKGYSFIPTINDICNDKLTIELNDGGIADLYVGTVMVSSSALKEMGIYNKNGFFQIYNNLFMVKDGKYMRYRMSLWKRICMFSCVR
jgi:hypothetical protein